MKISCIGGVFYIFYDVEKLFFVMVWNVQGCLYYDYIKYNIGCLFVFG